MKLNVQSPMFRRHRANDNVVMVGQEENRRRPNREQNRMCQQYRSASHTSMPISVSQPLQHT